MFSCSHVLTPSFSICHFLPPFYPFSHLIFRNLGKTFPRDGRIYIDYQCVLRKIVPIFPFSHFPTPSFSKCKKRTVETHCMRLMAGTCEMHWKYSNRVTGDAFNASLWERSVSLISHLPLFSFYHFIILNYAVIKSFFVK